MSSSNIICTICSKEIVENSCRMHAKFFCGHVFHYDCITSPNLNCEPALKCPNNCEDPVDNGQEDNSIGNDEEKSDEDEELAHFMSSLSLRREGRESQDTLSVESLMRVLGPSKVQPVALQPTRPDESSSRVTCSSGSYEAPKSTPRHLKEFRAENRRRKRAKVNLETIATKTER